MEQAGHYQIVRRLGQGGMAEVFEGVARSPSGFRRRVAVKRMLPELLGDPSAAQMFVDEARIASHLHHPAIVSVLDFGVVDGTPFQVLELVDGMDLEQLLTRAVERGCALSTELCVHVAVQVAEALDYAHRARDEAGLPLAIVHRDVSPSNVLISREGHVKLSDFGIALATTRVERTLGNVVKGKLSYMAPEQATRGPVDARADVFALGCLLHRMLAGESPLAEPTALGRLVLGDELALSPTIPSALAEPLREALRRSPGTRLQSAAAFAAALGAAHASGPAQTLALKQLVSVLAPVPELAAPARGQLDQLLGFDLTLVGEHASTRTFATRPHAVPEAQPSPAPHRSARLLAGSLAVAGLAVALVSWSSGLWSSGREPQPAPPVMPTPSAPARPITAASAPTRDEPPPAAKAVEQAARPQARPRRPTPAVVAPPAPAAVEQAGTLAIGGTGAQRARIMIDGVERGFAPKRLELSAGEHEVLLVAPDGSARGPFRVAIGSEHTLSHPARLHLDGPPAVSR